MVIATTEKAVAPPPAVRATAVAIPCAVVTAVRTDTVVAGADCEDAGSSSANPATGTGADADPVLFDEDGIRPAKNAQYGEKRYWDERFRREVSKEWLVSYADVSGRLEAAYGGAERKRSCATLLVGCGNSALGPSMVADGYVGKLVNSDYSEVVLAAMEDLHPRLSWKYADMLSLSSTFEVATFDYIIDKSSMDALVTDEGDVWNPNESSRNIVTAIFREAHLVLKPGGALIQISLQQPHFRKLYLRDLGEDGCAWLLESAEAIQGTLSFFYVWRPVYV